MKMTWKGEEGGPDAITLGGIEFPAGKAVDVPESFGAGGYLGNPYFKLEGAPKEPDALPVMVVDDQSSKGKGK